MSLGPHPFRSNAGPGAIFKRFLLFYLVPLAAFIVILIYGAPLMEAMRTPQTDPAQPPPDGLLPLLATIFVGVYLVLPIIALAFYAKYLRVVIGSLSLHTLDFRFDARTKDWFMLILGDIGLVIVTFGIGAIFLNYRHWKFFVTHLDAAGQISLAELTQSTTAAPGQGEGLADAFDIGAI